MNTTGIVRDSSFNGLPDSFVAINLDGVNNNENLNKSSEGLFATISPRQDAVEAVTVTTAAAGADVGGHGAVQINFVTRAGSNRFDGSAYEYHRDPSLNSNYWFNRNAGLPKNDVTLNQYGFRQGGPLIIPQVYDGRGKAFFFVNYEELRFPSDATRTRVVYNPLTQAGVMQYNITSGSATTVRQVNMLALAAANGFSAALDPVVTRTLGSIRAATAGTGLVTQQTDPNLMNFTWQSAAVALDRQPVVRLDYNLSSNHRLTGTFNEQIVTRDPDLSNNGDVRFPGGHNLQIYSAHRPMFSTALRSTIGRNLVNELRGGARWSPSYFGLPETSGPQTFQDTAGYSLTLGGGITGWTTTNAPSFRNAWNYQFDDTLSWQRGTHSVSMGGELYFGNITLINQQTVPSIGFGVAAADPVSAVFTTANFPGASSAQLDTARAIFATLTGRVSSVGGQLAVNPDTGLVRVPDAAEAKGRAQRVLGIRPGRVAGDADGDAQRRRALAGAAPLVAQERHPVSGDVRRRVRHLGHRRGWPVPFLRAWRVGRPGPVVHADDEGIDRLRDRLEQLRAERRRGLAPQRPGRAAAPHSR